jgi:hypothetical protein
MGRLPPFDQKHFVSIETELWRWNLIWVDQSRERCKGKPEEQGTVRELRAVCHWIYICMDED